MLPAFDPATHEKRNEHFIPMLQKNPFSIPLTEAMVVGWLNCSYTHTSIDLVGLSSGSLHDGTKYDTSVLQHAVRFPGIRISQNPFLYDLLQIWIQRFVHPARLMVLP